MLILSLTLYFSQKEIGINNFLKVVDTFGLKLIFKLK